MTTNNELTEAGWSFDNSYTSLPQLFYTFTNPTPVAEPKLVRFNTALARSLGLRSDVLNSEAGAEIFAGNSIPDGAEPIAEAYAGHQFGSFTMLGDGRAILLGEQLAPDGERFDIQLKGSGPTPYSRRGDGRAALGPMLREYIISEAMHGLGIPTTRSLAVVTTGETVYRETKLRGAIVTRVAASHLRVGTFEFAAQWGKYEDLQALADYALERHFPAYKNGENRYLQLLQQVIRRQAELIASWQLAGFIHGVMNTDNMAISGETIDYGPCAFMDVYDPATVFSSIDREGRYAYGNQPYIGSWNLARFAESLLPLLHSDESEAIQLAEAALKEYSAIYSLAWLGGMRAKLGLFEEEEQDAQLIKELLELMQQHRADYTNTFAALTTNELEQTDLFAAESFKSWHGQWQDRLNKQNQTKDEAHQLMRRSNPAVIPRNHRVEEALEAAVQHDDYTVLEKLLAVLDDPYAYSQEQKAYAALSETSAMPYRTFCGT
ncbi:protein adenylyltransferase SelO [Paenibacillus sp. IITD108]|uniref:protein adenylyltransferase SelO n=1 Tax=Paenibacillus sp. IITD108 TaxID=3116649 RepID=UPI002F428816